MFSTQNWEEKLMLKHHFDANDPELAESINNYQKQSPEFLVEPACSDLDTSNSSAHGLSYCSGLTGTGAASPSAKRNWDHHRYEVQLTFFLKKKTNTFCLASGERESLFLQ